MSQIVQRESFIQAGVTQSPYVWKNGGRYEVVTFYALGGTITKVEAAPNDSDFFDITANTGLLNVSTTGVAVAQRVSFKTYRITFTGTLYINAN